MSNLSAAKQTMVTCQYRISNNYETFVTIALNDQKSNILKK